MKPRMPQGRGPHRGGGRGPKQRPLDHVRAPYNFVPLSSRVVLPEWSGAVRQDHPFAEGICGRLEVEIEAVTPIFIRGEGERFFCSPDGAFALPGSSLRGMLRNVVEIATFSRLSRVNDHRYGVRDLYNRELYGKHMSAIHEGRPTPLVSAGWLRRNTADDSEEFPAVLTPCSFAKIEYGLLEQLARERGVRGFDPGRKQSSPDKYRAWGSASREVEVQLDASKRLEANPPGSPPRIGAFGKVQRLGGSTQGTLVFTGQPSRWNRAQMQKRRGAGNPKHHDFVFHDPIPERQMKVAQEIWKDFRFVHSDGGEQHRLTDGANPEWLYWLKSAFLKDEPVPVFFLLNDDSTLRAMGLAMMFRLPYKTSTKEAVSNAQPLAFTEPERRDLSELIFGYVPTDRRDDADPEHRGLKGRVSVGLGRPEGEPKELSKVTAVLGTPKASYYPNYVEQRDDGPGRPPATGSDGKPRYQTWMDEDAKARGWKRFQVRTELAQPTLPTKGDGSVMDISRVGTSFRPLDAGTRFQAPIRVHNLLPEELGALLWALDFGGDPEALHSLGMAKSMGYGAVRLKVTSTDLDRVDGQPVDLDRCRQAFIDYMEGQLSGEEGGWRGSREIFELLTLAQPAPSDRLPDLRHMRIDHPDFRNEFQNAKLQGLSLSSAGADLAWRKEVRANEQRAEEREKAREAEEAAERDRRERARLEAMSPEERARLEHQKQLAQDRQDLEEAIQRGEQYPLLEQWIAQGGPLEQERRKLARELVKIGKKQRYKRANIVEWIEG